MPDGTCSGGADFARTFTPVGSLVGGGSLPAADRIKLAAPRLRAGFSPALCRATPLPRCYGMAVLRATFPDGITGEPIWSLQSLTHLDGGPTWIVAVPDETRSACLLRQQSEDMLRRFAGCQAGACTIGIEHPWASWRRSKPKRTCRPKISLCPSNSTRT